MTRVASSYQRRHNVSLRELKRFLKDVSLGLALALSWLDHPVSVKDHSEVVLLPVGVVLLIILSYHSAPAKEYPEVILLPIVLT